MTTIDFSKALADAKNATFETLPIGDYDVEVTKCDAVTSSNGRPMLKAMMKVIVGQFENRPLMNNFVLTVENPVALSMFFRHMKAFGISEDFFAQLGANGSLEPVAAALVGRRARLTLGHREWHGENRNEVNAVKPYTGAPGTALGGPGAMPGPGGFMPNMTTPSAPTPPAPPMPATPPTPPTAPVQTAPVAPPVPAQPVAAPVVPEAPAAAPESPYPLPSQEPTTAVTQHPAQDIISEPTTEAPPAPVTEQPASAPTPPPLPI